MNCFMLKCIQGEPITGQNINKQTENDQNNAEQCCYEALTSVWIWNQNSPCRVYVNNIYFIIELSNGESS